MIFKSTLQAIEHTAKYHTEFAGFSCNDEVNVFEAMIKLCRFFKKESSVASVTVPAVLFDDTKTNIEVSYLGNDGWEFIERPA